MIDRDGMDSACARIGMMDEIECKIDLLDVMAEIRDLGQVVFMAATAVDATYGHSMQLVLDLQAERIASVRAYIEATLPAD